MLLPKIFALETVPQTRRPGGFSGQDGRLPEKKIRVFDPETQRDWGYIVVDDTRRGPGLGGIRIAPDLTLSEVARLAWTMTLKNSSANLPFGGGKSGLIADPQFLAQNPGIKRDLIGLFAEVLFEVDDYISAPDMGTNDWDVQQIYEYISDRLGTTDHMRGGSSRPAEKGGIPIDAWGLTAQGLFAAAKSMETLDSSYSLNQAAVVIQGYGNVGAWTATKLRDAGARVVGVSDIHGGLWNAADGLNVDELNAIRTQPEGIKGYASPVERRFDSTNRDWLLEAPCDILVPAARPDAITAKNADRVQCRMILQGANSPINKMTEYYLKNRRGILSLSDFIVNVGGVIGCGVELKMQAEPDYRKKVQDIGTKTYLDDLIFQTVSKNVREIHERLAARNDSDRLFREEALLLAEERLNSPPEEYWL